MKFKLILLSAVLLLGFGGLFALRIDAGRPQRADRAAYDDTFHTPGIGAPITFFLLAAGPGPPSPKDNKVIRRSAELTGATRRRYNNRAYFASHGG